MADSTNDVEYSGRDHELFSGSDNIIARVNNKPWLRY